MAKGLRWLGLGVSLGATLSIVRAGAGRRLALPRVAAPLGLGPGPAVDPKPDAAVGLAVDAVEASGVEVDWGRRPDQDRRSSVDRRVRDLDGLAGRIVRAMDKRRGADRRSGSERRLPGGEAPPQELRRDLNTAA